MKNVILIMAGGSGTRLFPFSTQDNPKQFIDIINNTSLLKQTYDRFQSFNKEDIFIITNENYRDLVVRDIPEINPKNIILEPFGKNTAPAIFYSSYYIKHLYDNENIVLTIVPSDHFILNSNKYIKNIEVAAKYAYEYHKGITLSIKMEYPATQYGYIKIGDSLNICDNIYHIDEFIEKPNIEKAHILFKQKDKYGWNSGIFVWKIKQIMNEVQLFCPCHYNILFKQTNFINILDYYNKVDKISIDYAIAEKSKDMLTIPCNMGWNDIGSFEAIKMLKDKNKLLKINEKILDYINSHL
jgi:mannose-1-phosphate guanylyltransferase